MYFLNPILKVLVRFHVAAKPSVLISFKKTILIYFVRFWVIFYVRYFLCGPYSLYKNTCNSVAKTNFIATREVLTIFKHFILCGLYSPHKIRIASIQLSYIFLNMFIEIKLNPFYWLNEKGMNDEKEYDGA